MQKNFFWHVKMGDETPKKSSKSLRSTPSSLPKPNFVPEPKSFSTKKVRLRMFILIDILQIWLHFNDSKNLLFFKFKQRGTPPLRPPPRPQPKTCPPVSRVFKRRQELFAAQAVTFLDSGESSSLRGTPLPSNNGIYDSDNKLSYFEQVICSQNL